MDNNIRPRQVNYKFWRDSKMMGMILLILTVTLQIFAFVKVPVFSTINAYTIGMLFGSANPLFYLYVIYVSLTMLFKDSTKIPSWIKLTKISYLFVSLSIIFIISSSGHYQTMTSWTDIGPKTFKVMEIWFREFTSQPAWYPASVWGGALGAFLYSFFSMITSGIGALIISIVLVVLSISFLVTGTSVGLYKGMIKKRKNDLAKIEIRKDDTIVDEELEEDKTLFEKPEATEEDEENEKKAEWDDSNPFPFEDPFK